MPYKVSREIHSLSSSISVSPQEYAEHSDEILSQNMGGSYVFEYLALKIEISIVRDGLHEQAVRDMVSVLERHIPRYPIRGYVHLGRIYTVLFLETQKKSDYKRATDYFKKTLEWAPNNPQALYDLRCLYLVYGEETRALDEVIIKNWGFSKECKIL